ncbi:N-acetylglucosamine-6-phosphate deacetylase [Kocuria rosea]|uniref:N-acetylglucosamine-6-phosphate deacetylase n=1 Tax=Kocuria rosea TaxID=1275 RepID=UPI0009E98CA9|nr:amidohydrolase family protein [Kocuria polaris]
MVSEDSPRRTVLSGRVHTGYAEHRDGLVVVEGDRVLHAGPRSGHPGGDPGEHLVLGPGQMILPGLVDVHCHGGFGADFSSSAEGPVRATLDAFHRQGTTTLVASLVTASRADMLAAEPLLAALTEDGLVAGIHLEGPFLSTARCGAQDPAEMREPDLGLASELIAAAAGTLRTMTFAPELPGAQELAELLVAHGVVPSLGHTDADTTTVDTALRRVQEMLRDAAVDGAPRLPTVTHLFNAMPAIHHRSPGPVPACLRAAAQGRAVVELIADGTHLDPGIVQWVFELAGADSIALVTDGMAATGLTDGTYTLGAAEVRVEDGVASLVSNGSIAGGTATMLEVLRRTVAAGVPLGDALRSATVVPARVLGLAGEAGSLTTGALADLLVVGEDLRPAAVMRRGRWISGTPPRPPEHPLEHPSERPPGRRGCG